MEAPLLWSCKDDGGHSVGHVNVFVVPSLDGDKKSHCYYIPTNTDCERSMCIIAS